MNGTAPPVIEPEAPTRSPLWPGLGGGGIAFGAIAAVGLVVGVLEYAASGGAYRLWTWIKVGCLYVASFCTVSLRVQVSSPLGISPDLRFRYPLLVGTALALWLLARAGRNVMRREAAAGPTMAGLVGAVAAFAVPVFLITLPATLRFPGIASVDVSAVRWQAAVYPIVVGVAGIAVGVFVEVRDRLPAWLSGSIQGGGRAFVLAVVLGCMAFLGLAALEPGPTGAYARTMQHQGRLGALTVGHHLLMLPAQSIWTLAPSMSGATEVSAGDSGVSRIMLDRVQVNAAAAAFLAPPRTVVPLGGGFYAFLLVPLAATVLGGRLAGADASSLPERWARGAGVGLVFALLVTAAAWASGAAVALPIAGWVRVVVGVAMPSTVVLALLWGVGGGVLGALTSGIGARAPQTPVPDPG